MQVGFIGLGSMGGRMAAHLIRAGHTLHLRDIGKIPPDLVAAGGQVCASGADVARNAEVIIIMVPQTRDVAEVLFGPDGAAAALAPGSSILLCPTIGPADTEALAARLAAAGLHPVDAPMSGGPERARQGTMSLMVACPQEVYDRLLPLLQALAARLFHVGSRPGDGARTKLVNNLLAAVNLAGAAEALALARRLGLDGPATLAVVEQSSGQSWIGSDRLRRAMAGDETVLARMALLAKDSALALGAAAAAGIGPGALPVADAAARTFQDALAAGLTDADDGALWAWRLNRLEQEPPVPGAQSEP